MVRSPMLKGEQYVEGGAHAIEPEDGVLTGNIVTTGTVDTNTPGMPSPKSRAAAFYYMHPQNRFWPVMQALFANSADPTDAVWPRPSSRSRPCRKS